MKMPTFNVGTPVRVLLLGGHTIEGRVRCLNPLVVGGYGPTRHGANISELTEIDQRQIVAITELGEHT